MRVARDLRSACAMLAAAAAALIELLERVGREVAMVLDACEIPSFQPSESPLTLLAAAPASSPRHAPCAGPPSRAHAPAASRAHLDQPDDTPPNSLLFNGDMLSPGVQNVHQHWSKLSN